MSEDNLVHATSSSDIAPNGQLGSSCAFDGPWFGAHYPDAICDGGYLHDADGDGYDPNDWSYPCPRCNTAEYLAGKREDAATTEHMSIQTHNFYDEVDGAEIWRRAKEWARHENSSEADEIIARLEAETPPPLQRNDGEPS